MRIDVICSIVTKPKQSSIVGLSFCFPSDHKMSIEKTVFIIWLLSQTDVFGDQHKKEKTEQNGKKDKEEEEDECNI